MYRVHIQGIQSRTCTISRQHNEKLNMVSNIDSLHVSALPSIKLPAVPSTSCDRNQVCSINHTAYTSGTPQIQMHTNHCIGTILPLFLPLHPTTYQQHTSHHHHIIKLPLCAQECQSQSQAIAWQQSSALPPVQPPWSYHTQWVGNSLQTPLLPVLIHVGVFAGILGFLPMPPPAAQPMPMLDTMQRLQTWRHQ